MPAIFAQRVYLYPLIGALQGLAIYFLVEQVGDSAPLIAGTALLFMILAPNLFYLSLPQARAALSVGFSVGLAVLFAGFTYMLGVNSGTPEPDMALTVPGWIIAVGLSLIALPFFQSHFARDETRSFYEWLHGFAWHNVFAIILSWVFVGVVWLMLFLLSALFELINITLLADLLEEAAFAATLTFATFGAGMAVTLQVPRVVEATHALAFALLRLLAAPFAAAVVLFLALLPFTGLEPLWETRSAAMLLLSIVAGAVLLVNAVWQDAPGTPDYPRWPLRVVMVQIIVLPAFAALAAYAMWLRIDQYGLTPERIYGSAVALVALTGTIAYALVSLLSRLKGYDLLRQTNIYLVAPVALIAFALITPLGDPMRISAVSQAERLRSGKVAAADFDFGALKFNLGKPGQEVLADLRADQTLPDRATIDERLAVLDKAQHHHEWSNGVQQATKLGFGDGGWKQEDGVGTSVMIRPQGQELPDGFWDFMKDPDNYDANPCFALNNQRCAFIIADIFPGDAPEIVLVREEPGGNQVMFRAYRHYGDGGWQNFYEYYVWQDKSADHEQLWQTIKDGAFELAPAEFQTLNLGGGIILFSPEENSLYRTKQRALGEREGPQRKPTVPPVPMEPKPAAE